MPTATFRIWRGEKGAGKFQDYTTEVSSGMVVLDAGTLFRLGSP